jgi:hypothetical protein
MTPKESQFPETTKIPFKLISILLKYMLKNESSKENINKLALVKYYYAF